ncbi:YhgE/Pip domain-containing protein [Neobacillus massiliamazoniensis]|uniref:ABC-2 type transporter n=1 Tax=Neobacillus massiliamazoniensis TaxID=1499688 RepID=A0A0U1NZU3_9BACI|nr:YhgE/Pip domain-containing protein [Neobacillus massiliamazoniensis]CRK83531.1 ABC-2 type transporter [Neobacillus massiliamazoniensis]
MKNSLLKGELSTIFKNKKILIPIIAVMLIPVLYAGMFLWAFWDPYAKLNKLPVAIVNDDQGATMDGEYLKIGDDLAKNLKKSKEFDFVSVDKEEGYKKLKNQKYYMLVEIPKDFSKNATTLLDQKPKKLELKYVPNEGYNFLSAQIGGSAAYKIKTAVAEQVTETYAETMFKKITESADGVKQASDGARKLSDGSIDLNKGSKDLKEGLATLAEKSIEFENGMKTADLGANKLATGSDDIKNGLAKADSNFPLLIDGTNQVYSGAEQLKKDLPAGIAGQINKQLTGSVGQLNNGIDTFESKLAEGLASQIADQTIAEQTVKMKELGKTLIAKGVPEELVKGIMDHEQENAPTKEKLQEQILKELSPNLDAAFKQFKSGVNSQLLGATNGLAESLQNQTNPYFDKLIGGIGTINQNQKLLQQGVHDLYVGSTQLNKGANDLSSGMNQLTAGAGAITSGSGQLADGSTQLNEGTTKISDGAMELADKLSDGAKEASKVHSNDKTYNMMANPVNLDTESVNRVPNYGTGFTPYFLSLGLFVGALLLSIVFPIREPAIVPRSGFNWFISKFSILASLGVIQALIADSVILGGLNLHVQSAPKFILFSIITSLTFVTLVQLLVTIFADAGRFIAIVILILQLTTSAGTFPLELIPGFLQHFNAFLPMTYTVSGFKAVISSGDFSYMWQNFLILLTYVLAFSFGTIAYLSMRYKSKYKEVAH